MRRKCNSTQVILLILVAVFTVLNPNFLSPFNLYNFLMQNEYRIVMITGLAIIMLGGEIDLSLGYQISLVGILIGKTTDGRCSGSDLYSHRTGGGMLLWTFKWISDSGA